MEENWQATIHRLTHSFEQIAATIRKFPEKELFDTFPGTENKAIYYLQGLEGMMRITWGRSYCCINMHNGR